MQTTAGRAPVRPRGSNGSAAIRAALAPLTQALDEDTARRATAVIAHLCSAASWVAVSDDSGLDDDDAQQAVAWAIDTLIQSISAPSRTDHANDPHEHLIPCDADRAAARNGIRDQSRVVVSRHSRGAAQPCRRAADTCRHRADRAARGSPPRHFHDALDDAFLLLDGEVVVRSGDQTVVARPGTYVVVPHGEEHTFRVTSRKPGTNAARAR